MKLVGKVAIVTGGGRGIGRATAEAFAGEGASVAVCARSSEEIEETASAIRSSGGEALAVAADISREADVADMVRRVLETFGRIDILVNNAGTNLPYREVVDLTLDEWRRVVDVNLTGPFLCSKAVLPAMIEQGSGKIVNISSIGGRSGAAGRSPYRPTKAALINFTQCLAAEVKRHGIDVNCVCPGGTATRMLADIARIEGRDDLMRPEEIASVVLFLASGESSAITGTAIDAFGASNPLLK
ncbi:MAG: SDR family oxidoreductase [Chloroflexi bacterium]|nr:SDR family oxidoreductase [Chloroflexota bacterium]